MKLCNKNITMIYNLTSDSTYDDFSSCYGQKVYLRCPLLSRFSIQVLSKDEYLRAQDVPTISDIDKQPMSCFISKQEAEINSTIAGIVVNNKLLAELSFSKFEKMAAFAHELGHLAFFFLNSKCQMDSLAEEVYADTYPRDLGLQKHLSSILKKLIESNWYDKTLTELIKYRYNVLNNN